MITFGPVPSRRLGRSLGINNIPPKVCSYSCIYCQVGTTVTRETEPRRFYPPDRILREVTAHIEAARKQGEQIDYLTFVPDGEPTLDAGLRESIDLLRPLGIPIAVISNGSLLWRPEVRAALAEADWVSVKVDAVTGDIWRRVDHPHSDLEISQVLEGIRRFGDGFNGDLCTETMLVSRVNDTPESLSAVAEYLSDLDIKTAYLAVPTRPPALPGVKPPDEWALNQAFHLLARRLPRVEYLIGYEGDAFAATGEIATDVLSISAVHPLRSSAIDEMLGRSGATWDVIEALVSDGQLKRVDYQGERYYLRSYPPGDGQEAAEQHGGRGQE